VEFLGYQRGEPLTALIRNASFVVVPSEWYENNPLTVIEAYAWGKPVIGTAVGGLPEIVLPGVTGFLFGMANADELAEVVLQAEAMPPRDYKELSLHARGFAEDHFSEDQHYIGLTQIYEAAIGHHG
jgi:glycosyltransferase involved in cell wall biosynthesis